MPWVPTVAPRQVISSSVWGNQIRDRTHHVFATLAERDTLPSGVTPSEGMTCWVAAEKVEFLYTQGAWWPIDMAYRTWTPRFYAGAVSQPIPIAAGSIQSNVCKISGFQMVQCQVMCTLQPLPGQGSLVVNATVPYPMAHQGLQGTAYIAWGTTAVSGGAARYYGNIGGYDVIDMYSTGGGVGVATVPGSQSNVFFLMNLTYRTAANQYAPTP